jgi:hypothetical protein
MKLFAISGLHLNHDANRQALSEMTGHPGDWLILAGDVGESAAHLELAFSVINGQCGCHRKPDHMICSSSAFRPGSSIRGVWPPRSTELPSYSVRWSIGEGASQCASFISVLRP